jgi:peptidoglycan-N-acetylglucosamine deacetylase
MARAKRRDADRKTPLCRYGSRLRRGRIALTFDDGPGPHSADIASVLERHGARGTFFVTGMSVAGREAALSRLAGAGHEIGNHSFDHSRAVGTSARAAYAQIQRTNAVVEALTGTRPRLYRPPWGRVTLRVLAVVRLAGMTPVMWSVDPRDWDGPSAAEIERRVLAKLRGGGIVLFHDGGLRREATVAALPGIVRRLQAAGYELVTVSELLAPWAR